MNPITTTFHDQSSSYPTTPTKNNHIHQQQQQQQHSLESEFSSSSSSSSSTSSSSSIFLPSPAFPQSLNTTSKLNIKIDHQLPSLSQPPQSLKLLFLPGPAINFNPHQNQLYPPSNFATIAPGLYRSSFPKLENFEFLNTLGLRTILTLVQEEYPIELVEYYHRHGIKLIQFRIPGNKEPFVHIPEDKIRLALQQVLDVRNHPMLIHCNKGKHRTGCLVGCLRKLQHWSSTAIFDEYRRYAFPKSRNMDQQFIELFDHSAVWEEIDPEFAPHWLDLSV